MACLDTTILVDMIRSNLQLKHRALEKLKQLSAAGERIVTTRLNLAELYVGIELSTKPEHDKRQILGLLEHFDAILEFDDLAAHVFGRIIAHLRRIGRPAGDLDLLIAATSIAAGHPLLITQNPSHFSDIPDLTVESY